MSGIHKLILEKLQADLIAALITTVADNTKAGVVKIGPLQGDPDPDQARISVELYPNDPDKLDLSGAGNAHRWDDGIEEVEVGGCVTWRRRFSIKARCLLENTKEDLTAGYEVASTVRSRIEKTLLTLRFNGLSSGDEYVSRGVIAESLHSDFQQSGGPPDSYDFHIKIFFEVLTTEQGGEG